jgi:hypothetical protein
MEQKKIIVPGADSPESIAKVLEVMADAKRVATVIVRRGERFLLKVVEVRKSVLVGEVRCLNWSPEMSRKIYDSFSKNDLTGEHRREVLLADAIEHFGAEAHRYRIYLPLDDIAAVYEDLEDRFDETPFLPLP